jgi:hypothetical protein
VDSQGAILLDSVTLTLNPQSDTFIGDGPLPLWSLGALGAALFGVVSRRRPGKTSKHLAQ